MIPVKNFLFAALLIWGISQSASARPDTIYYDKDWKVLPGRTASHFYRVREQQRDGDYEVKDYYMNGTLQMSGTYRDTVRHGYFTYYNESGLKSSEGLCKNDRHEGEWKYYRQDDEHVWYTQTFLNDTLQGIFKSYYKSGKLKREEIYQDGKRISGRRFSEAGTEMVFTPFEIMPHPSVDIAEFLRSNIKYPEECRKKNVTGKVIVKFVVSTDGIIESLGVVKSVHPLLDQEAIRVIAAMPAWRPGMTDDEPVRVYHTQPINFRLN